MQIVTRPSLVRYAQMRYVSNVLMILHALILQKKNVDYPIIGIFFYLG